MLQVILWILLSFFAAIGIFISVCFGLCIIGNKLGMINMDWKTWERKDGDTKIRASRNGWLVHRLLVLGSYGYGMEFYETQKDPDFLTDEWLEKWFGEPLPEDVMDKLHEVELA